MKLAMRIYYDSESGELMKIKESHTFSLEDSLLRADVLQDCLGVLKARYDESSNKYFNNLESMFSIKKESK